MSSAPPPPPPEGTPEIRVATSAKLSAKLKINSAPSEIIDATAAQILLSQPNHEMDFYELATAVFNAFEVEGVRRLAVTRHMLRFRRELEAARSSRDAWLQKRLEVGQRLVPSLVDASFMQFVLRMLSYFENGLTEREIAQCWLDQHTSWFGDAYRDTVEALGSKMLDPVLRSLLARQDEWDIQLVQRIDPDAAPDAGRQGSLLSSGSGASSSGSTQPSAGSSAPASDGSAATTGRSTSETSSLSGATGPSDASGATSLASSSDAGKVVGADAPTSQQPDSAVRWKSVAPFDSRQKAVIVPALMFDDFPSSDNHPVQGSLSYYLPPYNQFFLATPNAAEASLATRFKHDNKH